MPGALIAVFLENIEQTMLFPIGHSMVFEAMYWFEKEMGWPAVALVLGSMLGCLINCLLGQALGFIRLRKRMFFSDQDFERIGSAVRCYGSTLLLFYWIPLGAIFVVIAGFFGVRRRYVLPLVGLGTILKLYLYFPHLF